MNCEVIGISWGWISFLKNVTVDKTPGNKGINFQIIIWNQDVVIKASSDCPWLKVVINTKGANISGYLISTFIFWKKKSMIPNTPHLNSFAYFPELIACHHQ